MHLIRCTNKLFTEMGFKKRDLLQNDNVSRTGLGDWYANLFRLSHYKCIIFTNEMTLFSFVYFSVKKKEILNLSDLFRDQFFLALQQEDIPVQVIDSILQSYTEIEYAPTSNRRVLGSMNDLVYCYGRYLEDVGEITAETLLQLNSRINRIPMKAIGFEHAVDKLYTVLMFRNRALKKQ